MTSYKAQCSSSRQRVKPSAFWILTKLRGTGNTFWREAHELPLCSHPPKGQPVLGSTRELGSTQKGTPSRWVTASCHLAGELLSYTHMRHWWIKTFTSPSWLHGRDQEHVGIWQKHTEHCCFEGCALVLIPDTAHLSPCPIPPGMLP